MGRYSGKTCRLSTMLTLTFSFFVVEIVFGYITNSMALIADSFHMLSDVLALLIAFACMKISRRSVSSKNTFGWVRAEVLGALVNAVFLMALCFSIFIEALKRIIEPEDIESPENILIVGILGLIINIIGIFMFHGHSNLHGHSHARPVPLDLPNDDEDEYDEQEQTATNGQPASRTEAEMNRRNSQLISSLGPIITGAHSISVLLEEQDFDRNNVSLKPIETGDFKDKQRRNENGGEKVSRGKGEVNKELLQASGEHQKQTKTPEGQLNMHGVFLHILGDAFGSVIVVVNALVCMYSGNKQLSRYLDPSLSLAIAFIITVTTLPLLKESAMILLQTVPTHLNVQEMKSKLLKSIDGVLAIHEFHVWRLAGNKIIATAHIQCRNTTDYMHIAEQVKEFFHKEGIHSTTIQPEFLEELNVVNEKVLSSEQCALECTVKECAASTCCSGAKATLTAAAKNPLTNAACSVASALYSENDAGGDAADRQSKIGHSGRQVQANDAIAPPNSADGDRSRQTSSLQNFTSAGTTGATLSPTAFTSSESKASNEYVEE